jgi:hypothetical protein
MAINLNYFTEATSSGRPIIENVDSMTCGSPQEIGTNGAFAKKMLPGIVAISLANFQFTSLSPSTQPVFPSSEDRSSLQVKILRQPTELCSKLNKAVYNGPQNLDSVLSYTWEGNEGGPSGEFKEKAHTVI